MSEKTNIESWDGLLTNYVKASNLEGQTDIFVCTGVMVEAEKMSLNIEKAEEKFVFGLNTTNKVFLKNNGIAKPKDVIGKKLTLEKVKAFNPTLKQEVNSLRVIKIEA